MKKLLSVLISVVICFAFVLPVLADGEQINISESAAGREVASYTEYFDDGSYTEVTIISEVASPSKDSGDMTLMSGAYYKNGTKILRQYNSSGLLIYSFSLHGVFYIVPGVYVTCINSSYSYTINNSTWSLSTASTYESADKAFGNATFIRRILLIPVETHHISMSLTCTINGTFY